MLKSLLFHDKNPRKYSEDLYGDVLLLIMSVLMCIRGKYGIIGRNGAGAITREKQPRAGGWSSRGPHPAMTGRENVYLNGQILGMSKREIIKFDDIVAFQVENYAGKTVFMVWLSA